MRDKAGSEEVSRSVTFAPSQGMARRLILWRGPRAVKRFAVSRMRHRATAGGRMRPVSGGALRTLLCRLVCVGRGGSSLCDMRRAHDARARRIGRAASAPVLTANRLCALFFYFFSLQNVKERCEYQQ